MSKLITPTALETLRKISDVGTGSFDCATVRTLVSHIDALTAELKSTESRLHEVVVACANAEHKLSRRDALAGEPFAVITYATASSVKGDFIYTLRCKGLLNVGTKLYAATPAPFVPDDLHIKKAIAWLNSYIYLHPHMKEPVTCRAAMLAKEGIDYKPIANEWERRAISNFEQAAAMSAHIAELEAYITSSAASQIPGILKPILAELDRAMKKFPSWPTDPIHASKILDEEVGELSKAVLQATYEPQKSGHAEVRAEAIQAAAMAIRFIASLDKYEYTRATQHAQPALANGDKGAK